ncbi:unnamed protein product [Periconia digitata]|uniref:RRM domain-containing protein n=1 Tax=Periconia digitata TaxID=1303443 RepID=A0A9W4XJ00_9PLEO|nr:unnamed protein product [Periconia digitata]
MSSPVEGVVGQLFPASSPFGGTESTLYSPELARQVAAERERQNAADNRSRSATLSATPLNVVRIGHVAYIGLVPQPHQNGIFTNERDATMHNMMSRYIFVTEVKHGRAGFDMESEMDDVIEKMKIYKAFEKASIFYQDGVFIRFDAVNDACEAMSIFKTSNFKARFVDSYDFAKAKCQDTIAINEFEAQVKLVVHLEYLASQQIAPTLKELAWLNDTITHYMSYTYGSIVACVHVGVDLPVQLHTFRVEFHSVDAANRAIASINLDPDSGVGGDNDLWQWASLSATAWDGPRAPNSPHRHKVRYDDMGRLTTFRHQPNTPTTGRKEAGGHPADSHNRVRRERILDGSDVRTTIMLRNIPNKLDWMALKAILDEICFGTYDFVYLRIDFKTCNNVGYAFINFVDVEGMIAMLQHVESRSWKGFKSNKHAEISYATIQGREALIQKFRNSSVMQETPFCRPHLFLTYQDAVAMNQVRKTGLPQAFPQPDNYSKLQRSMHSARSVGLFPPSGIMNANIQRSMISAYDRGTPRDLVHTMNAYRQQGDGMAPISQYDRMQCEAWYASKSGLGRNATVPFNEIPFGSVQQFLALTRGGNNNRAGGSHGPIAPPRMVRQSPGYFNAGLMPSPMIARGWATAPRGY